ncbi:c-type cytochrome [Methylibium sp.]|uniref:c-type cytochrome n=1 Tax=Methylibium sp. TaxID=2067992 RepID=UPI0038620E95
MAQHVLRSRTMRISPLLLLLIALPAAAADAERGRSLYQSRCTACHSIEYNGVGPAHRGMFGRRAGLCLFVGAQGRYGDLEQGHAGALADRPRGRAAWPTRGRERARGRRPRRSDRVPRADLHRQIAQRRNKRAAGAVCHVERCVGRASASNSKEPP